MISKERLEELIKENIQLYYLQTDNRIFEITAKKHCLG